MKRISSSNGYNPGNADKWAFPGLLYFIGNTAIAYIISEYRYGEETHCCLLNGDTLFHETM